MISYIEKAYQNYVDRHKSRPNLLFIDEKVFYELIKNQNDHSNFRYSFRLNHHTFLGCMIIKMQGHGFGYKFYEFEELFNYKDTTVLYGRNLIIEKVPLEDSISYIAPSDPRILTEQKIIRLEVPLEVMEAFKKKLNHGLTLDHLNDIQYVFKEILIEQLVIP